jgi:hypothetical protein
MSARMDVLLGAQWGDEGKGKVVDVIAPEYPVIARFQGGPNAGHTLIFEGRKHVLHTIPSGVFRGGTMNLVGNGVVIDPIVLMKEISALEAVGVDVRDQPVDLPPCAPDPTLRTVRVGRRKRGREGQLPTDRQHAEGHRTHLHGQDRSERPARRGPMERSRHGWTVIRALVTNKHERLLGLYEPNTTVLLRRKTRRTEWLAAVARAA